MSGPTLRVLTLNCWNISSPFEERMALIREGIEKLQPDVVGLQEIIVRRDGFDQGAMIFDGLGYETIYGAAVRWTEAEPLLPHHAEGDAYAHAKYVKESVIPKMAELRTFGDKLETMVADDLWPLPTYREMLFIK